MARSRRRGRSSRKSNKLLFEAGIAIILVLVAYIALSAISMQVKSAIVTTETLWAYNEKTKVMIRYGSYNTTTGYLEFHEIVEYALKDIASYSNGYLYISIPQNSPKNGYDLDLMTYFAITLVTDNKTLTHNDLIEKGLNKIEIFIQVLNSTNILMPSSPSPQELSINDYDGVTLASFHGNVILSIHTFSNISQQLNEYLNGTTFEKDVDLGSYILTVTSKGASSHYPVIVIPLRYADPSTIDGFKIRINLYAVSEKPLFAWLTEPFAVMWGALVGAFYSLWEKTKSVVLGAFSGATMGAVFTGLVENPYIAILLVSLIFLIIAYFAYEKKSRRRRR